MRVCTSLVHVRILRTSIWDFKSLRHRTAVWTIDVAYRNWCQTYFPKKCTTTYDDDIQNHQFAIPIANLSPDYCITSLALASSSGRYQPLVITCSPPRLGNIPRQSLTRAIGTMLQSRSPQPADLSPCRPAAQPRGLHGFCCGSRRPHNRPAFRMRVGERQGAGHRTRAAHLACRSRAPSGARGPTPPHPAEGVRSRDILDQVTLSEAGPYISLVCRGFGLPVSSARYSNKAVYIT
jgi:hypothetical protein